MGIHGEEKATMFERFKRNKDDHDEGRGAVATADRERVIDRDEDREVVERDLSDRTRGHDGGSITRTRGVDEDRTAVRDRDDDARTGTAAATGAAAGGLAREDMRYARARQRDEFGGINWGAAFFGWLVAVGMAALLVAIASAAGAAIGLTETVSSDEAQSNAEEITLFGGIVLVAILLVAYYAGGYVAGRMSRFDGGRQGIGVWLLGLLVTIGLAALGAIAGSEYNVLEQLDLPRIPVDEGDLATGGIIALAAVVLGTLVAAMFGGKVGERYHRRVDRVAIVD
jgi:hypothetical protein